MGLKQYDVLVIGGGAAGATAALYLGRYARTVAVVGKDLGATCNAGEIENWPGTKTIGGMELINNFQDHSKEYGAEYVFAQIENIIKTEYGFVVEANGTKIEAKTVIFANGTLHKKLEIPGEAKLVGKGVSYCATCDGMFFKDKEVVVIGGADAAAKATLYLADVAKKVTLIYRRGKLRCEPIYYKRIDKKNNIEIIYNATPEEIIGEEKVKQIKIKVEGEEKIINTDGIFVEIGALPCVKLSTSLGMNCSGKGYIEVNSKMETSIPGVFAAGDITNTPLKQIVTAAGNGAIAAYSAHEYLQKLE